MSDPTRRKRGRVIRPQSQRRRELERIHERIPVMAFIPVNESQRREERRRRRAFIREQIMKADNQPDLLVADAMDSAAAALGTSGASSRVRLNLITREELNPITNMIVQMMSEAVISSLDNHDSGNEFMLHLSGEMIEQMQPPNNTNERFFRIIQIPLVNEVGRIVHLPMILNGYYMEEQWIIHVICGTKRTGDNVIGQEDIDRCLESYRIEGEGVKQRIIGDSSKCQVCLNEYEHNQELRILLCNHGFHKACIDQWLIQGQNQCPLCRQQVVPIDQ